MCLGKEVGQNTIFFISEITTLGPATQQGADRIMLTKPGGEERGSEIENHINTDDALLGKT